MKRKSLIVLFFAIFILGVVLLPIDYYEESNLYYYSDSSIKNGINISRWYGQLENINPIFTRILFNKFLYPQIIIIKILTVFFQNIIDLVIL
jgi:acyl-CoA synthetase (AMP-forming)/AMP-acid ligase II